MCRHDFVVVETIEFFDDEDEVLRAPPFSVSVLEPVASAGPTAAP